MVQLHKKFTDSEVKNLIEHYLRKEIKKKYIQELLGIRKTRFFALIKDYRKNPNTFSIQYIRSAKTELWILNQEIHRYNYKQIHSTTKEIPYFWFQRALKENKSLFREFKIKPPYQSVKDIFCLRIKREPLIPTEEYPLITYNWRLIMLLQEKL